MDTANMDADSMLKFPAPLAVALGLAIGDALGETSEFQIPWEVQKNCIDKYPGWPAKLVGGGKANWRVGQPSDDSEMAIAIVRAVKENNGKLDPDAVLRHFVKWMDTKPKDIGSTTRIALQNARDSDNWFDGGKIIFENNPNNAANGSLMRNGVVAALFPGVDQEEEVLDATVCHGIITHYQPLTVLTCIVHSLLIRQAILRGNEELKAPTLHDINTMLESKFEPYLSATTNAVVQTWVKTVGGIAAIKQAKTKLMVELAGFETFNPYIVDYRGISGYSALTLKIALWALHWSLTSGPVPPVPTLPKWIFEKRGFETLMWVVAIGADADTYGATAGPLLAAYHPEIPSAMLENLELAEEFKAAFN